MATPLAGTILKQNNFHRSIYIIGTMVIFAGIILRLLYAPETLIGYGDHLTFYKFYYQWVKEAEFPYMGPFYSNIGSYFAPAYLMNLYYAFLFSITKSFVVMTLIQSIFLILLSPLVIYAAYLLFKQKSIAFLSYVIYIISPWIMAYSGSLWHYYFFPSVSALVIIIIYKTIATPKSRWVIMLPLSLYFLYCTHVMAMFIGIAVVFILIISGLKRIHWKFAGLGILLLIIVLLPYIIGEITHDFSNLKRLQSVGGMPYLFESFKVILGPLLIASGEMSQLVYPHQFDRLKACYTLSYGTPWIGIGASLISVVSILFLYYRVFMKIRHHIKLYNKGIGFLKSWLYYLKDDPKRNILFCIVMTPILCFIVSGRGFAERYSLIFAIPTICILAYALVDVLQGKKNAWLLTTISGLVVVTYALSFVGFIRYQKPYAAESGEVMTAATIDRVMDHIVSAHSVKADHVDLTGFLTLYIQSDPGRIWGNTGQRLRISSEKQDASTYQFFDDVDGFGLYRKRSW